jgi:hypothetical protein
MSVFASYAFTLSHTWWLAGVAGAVIGSVWIRTGERPSRLELTDLRCRGSDGPERLAKYVIILARITGSAVGHCLRPRNGLLTRTSGCSGPRSWLRKKLSFWLGFVALCTVEAPCTDALIGRYPILFSFSWNFAMSSVFTWRRR